MTRVGKGLVRGVGSRNQPEGQAGGWSREDLWVGKETRLRSRDREQGKRSINMKPDLFSCID